MDYYHLNLSILREREPDLARRLEMVRPGEDTSLFEETRSKPLDPNLRLEDADVFVILGIGWGVHLVELILRAPLNSLVLVIEPDLGLFKTLISMIDIRPIFQRRVSLAICEDPFTAVRVRLDNYFHITTLARIKIIEYPPSVKLNPQYYQAIRYNLSEVCEMAKGNIATLTQFAPEWQRHILINLEAIIRYPGVKGLFGRFKNQPAIIVSAGPSLDKNIDRLSRAKGRAVIIAVDTALRSLHLQGITPDLVVAIDSGQANLKDFEGVSLTHENLVAVPVTHPKIISLFGDSTFITSYGHPLMEWIEGFIGQKGFTKVGGSVATTAFDLARNMQSNPIILVGQDLAYSNGMTHARGASVHSDEWLEGIDKFHTIETRVREYIIDKGVVWVEDIYGGRVMTSKLMAGWIKWLGSQIAEARRNNGIITIDATEGGAKIPGTQIMGLDQAIETYCQKRLEVKKVLSGVRRNYKIPPLSPLIKGIEEILEEWQQVKTRCESGKGIAEELSILLKEKGPESKVQELFKGLNDLFRWVMDRRQIMQIYRWTIEPILVRTIGKKRGSDRLEMVKVCQDFFGGMDELAQTSILQMEAARKTLKRMEHIHSFFLPKKTTSMTLH